MSRAEASHQPAAAVGEKIFLGLCLDSDDADCVEKKIALLMGHPLKISRLRYTPDSTWIERLSISTVL